MIRIQAETIVSLEMEKLLFTSFKILVVKVIQLLCVKTTVLDNDIFLNLIESEPNRNREYVYLLQRYQLLTLFLPENRSFSVLASLYVERG